MPGFPEAGGHRAELAHDGRMVWERTTLPGRAGELSTLDSALAATTASRHTLALVRGEPGTDRTALLATAAARWRRRGITVLAPRFTSTPDDPLGARAVLDAVREHYTWSGDFSLAGPVDAAVALCAAGHYETEPMLDRLAELFDKVRTACPTVLIADDLDAVPEPAPMIAAACLPAYLVVAAVRDTSNWTPAPDHLIDLGPPAEHAQASSIEASNLKIS